MADISQFITVTPLGVSKQYTQGSGQAPMPDTILVQNTSPDTDVTANITSAGGVIFSPSSFTVTKNSNISIQITYDISQLETLTQGLNTINTVFTFSPVGSTAIPVTPTPTPTITPPPNIQLAIQTAGGPVSSIAGQTTDFYAAGNGAFAVTFKAYNNINGVVNTVPLNLQPSIQWTLNGPNISNAIVGTGPIISITFSTAGIYVIQAAINTSGVVESAQSDIQIVIMPVTPQPTFVLATLLPTPTPTVTPIPIDILPKPPVSTPIPSTPTPTPTPIVITPTPFIPAPPSGGNGGSTPGGSEGGGSGTNLAD